MEQPDRPPARPEDENEGTPTADLSRLIPEVTRAKLEAQLTRQARQLREVKAQQERQESELLPPVITPPRPRKRYPPRKHPKGLALPYLPRRKEIVDLRVSGKATSWIADELGVSLATVQKHLRDWVTSQTPSDEATAELRRIMHERLEAMHERHWGPAMGRLNEDGTWAVPPSRDAGEFLLKIMDREAKLMGVDLQPSSQTLLISAESIAAYLGWDPQPGHTAVVEGTAYEIEPPAEEPDGDPV